MNLSIVQNDRAPNEHFRVKIIHSIKPKLTTSTLNLVQHQDKIRKAIWYLKWLVFLCAQLLAEIWPQTLLWLYNFKQPMWKESSSRKLTWHSALASSEHQIQKSTLIFDKSYNGLLQSILCRCFYDAYKIMLFYCGQITVNDQHRRVRLAEEGKLSLK